MAGRPTALKAADEAAGAAAAAAALAAASLPSSRVQRKREMYVSTAAPERIKPMYHIAS